MSAREKKIATWELVNGVRVPKMCVRSACRCATSFDLQIVELSRGCTIRSIERFCWNNSIVKRAPFKWALLMLKIQLKQTVILESTFDNNVVIGCDVQSLFLESNGQSFPSLVEDFELVEI